jgi:hypothetical protein
MVPIREEEARYLVIQLVKKYPRLTDLLFKLQGEGAGWARLLQLLEQAVADGGGDHADHTKGNFIHQISLYLCSFSLNLLGNLV